MKSFRFIVRGAICDWLQVINANTLEEAISMYDYNHTKYEVKEIENRKGCVLAFHITPDQAKEEE